MQNEEREAGKSAEKGLPLEEETCGRAEETPEKEVQELPAENVPAEEEPEAAVSGSTGTGDKQADIHRKAEALAEQHFQRQKTRKGRPVSWDVDKAKELWTSGSSPEEVCDAVGITTAAFSSYRFRHPDVFPDHEV